VGFLLFDHADGSVSHPSKDACPMQHARTAVQVTAKRLA
jgi:hypothetical protein